MHILCIGNLEMLEYSVLCLKDINTLVSCQKKIYFENQSVLRSFTCLLVLIFFACALQQKCYCGQGHHQLFCVLTVSYLRKTCSLIMKHEHN